MDSSLIVEAARAMVGVPFRMHGRSRKGIDCVGLVIHSLSAAGLQVEDAFDYGWLERPERLRRELARIGTQRAQVRPGHVLLLILDGRAGHMGIAGSCGTAIHASVQRGVREDRFDSNLRCAGAYEVA